MTADIFVAAFLGCLLALAVVAIAAWQISAFLIRRKIGSIAKLVGEGIEGAADGDPALRAELDAFARRRAYKASPMVRPPMIRCGACGIVHETPFSDSRSFMESGWRVHAASGDLHCPACVRKNHSPGTSICLCGHEQASPPGMQRADVRAYLVSIGWGIVEAELRCSTCVRVATEAGAKIAPASAARFE